MEGPRRRAKTSPIDGNLCVIDMRDLAVGSSLARKRKSEGGRDQDDERRSLDRKTQHAVEYIEDAGMSDWSAAPPRNCRSTVANGTRVRVASGRYTGLIGVAVDVGGAQVKVELPQPSRLETLYVRMEQLEATSHIPTKAGRCTTRMAKTPARGGSRKRIWDSFPSPTSDGLEPVVAAASATETRENEAGSGELLQTRGLFPTAFSFVKPHAYTFSCSGSGSCCLPLGGSSFQATGRGAEADAAGGAATATSCSRGDGNNRVLAHSDSGRGDVGSRYGGGVGGGGGSATKAADLGVALLAPVSGKCAGQLVPKGVVEGCEAAEYPVAVANGEAGNGDGSPTLGGMSRGRTKRSNDYCDTLSNVPSRTSCRCSRRSSSSSSCSDSNSCSSGSDSEDDGDPCEDLRNAPDAAERQARRSPDHRRRQHQIQQLRSEDTDEGGGSYLCPHVPLAITSPDMSLPSSLTISARPPAVGHGVPDVSASGRLWPRPRPPGLTLGVAELDTEVCAGGLTKATQVLDHLWVSGQEVTGDKGGLQREGVTHIVNCSIRLANFYPKDFSYHRVSWADESGQNMDPPVLEVAFRHIDAARRHGKACLVHCKAGTSRSCSLVLGYLMQLDEGMSLMAALAFCQAKRRQCNPDKYFLERLSEYEERLFGQTSVSLDDYHRGDVATSLAIGSRDAAKPASGSGGRSLSLLQ